MVLIRSLMSKRKPTHNSADRGLDPLWLAIGIGVLCKEVCKGHWIGQHKHLGAQTRWDLIHRTVFLFPFSVQDAQIRWLFGGSEQPIATWRTSEPGHATTAAVQVDLDLKEENKHAGWNRKRAEVESHKVESGGDGVD